MAPGVPLVARLAARRARTRAGIDATIVGAVTDAALSGASAGARIASPQRLPLLATLHDLDLSIGEDELGSIRVEQLVASLERQQVRVLRVPLGHRDRVLDDLPICLAHRDHVGGRVEDEPSIDRFHGDSASLSAETGASNICLSA